MGRGGTARGTMKRRNTAVSFALCLGVIYGLLISPWPGWRSTYSRFFQGMTQWTFGREQGDSIVRVHPAGTSPHPEIDTQILLIDRASANSAGRAPARILEIDSRGVGWVPTALVIALACASPLPWVRRIFVLLVGMLVVNAYVLFAVAAFLWNQSGGRTPVSVVPYWPSLGSFLEQTFVTQLGPSFAVPVLIWLLAMVVAGKWSSLFFAAPAKASIRQKPP